MKIIIHYLDELKMRIECEEYLEKEIQDEFSFYVQNYQYHPKVKYGLWDGKIRLYNYRDKTMYTGLLFDLFKWAKLNNYTVEIANGDKDKLRPQIKLNDEWINEFQNEKAVYDFRYHQKNAFEQAIKFNKALILAPTGCHAKGQEVILFDGNTKKVEDVKVGDLLMGVDSTPRKVLSLHRGKQEMRRIKPNFNPLYPNSFFNKSFVVNKDHILSLIDITTREIVNITVDEYQKAPNTNLRLYKPACLHTDKETGYRLMDLCNKNSIVAYGAVKDDEYTLGLMDFSQYNSFEVINLPIDDYYGFEVDNDNLYLLDDFTVTHNSGKSFLCYALVRYLVDYGVIDNYNKFLINVPSINLVNQLYSDFQEYTKDDFNVEKMVTKVGGDNVEEDKPIIISTWQTTMRKKKSYFENIFAYILDEAHQATANEISKIIDNLSNCTFRIGTTATLDGTDMHELGLRARFGKIYRAATTKELMECGDLAKLIINCHVLKYIKDDMKKLWNELKGQTATGKY